MGQRILCGHDATSTMGFIQVKLGIQQVPVAVEFVAAVKNALVVKHDGISGLHSDPHLV